MKERNALRDRPASSLTKDPKFFQLLGELLSVEPIAIICARTTHPLSRSLASRLRR